MNRGAATLFAAVAMACTSGGSIPAPDGGSVAMEPVEVLSFHQRAETFYGRIVKRRFNTLETFNDPILRRHFQSADLFFDYYAGLAETLDAAHFEKSRPLSVEVQEFIFEDPSRVRVQLRFTGHDDRPLRPDRTHVIRLDLWERADNAWWITPGKL